MHELQCPAPSEGGGLLRVLFLWISEVPTDAGVGWLLRCCLALRRPLRVPDEQERATMRPQVTESEMATPSVLEIVSKSATPLGQVLVAEE